MKEQRKNRLKNSKVLPMPLLQYPAQIEESRWLKSHRGIAPMHLVSQYAGFVHAYFTSVNCLLRCRRAAHFATFRTEDDENGVEDNVHVGGDEVR